MSGPGENILVIGLGNPDRGDDGIGPLVANAVSRLAPAGVRMIIRSGDMLVLLEDWKGADVVLIADAAALISEPGRIHRIDAAHEALPASSSSPSTHAFGLAEAVELARTLDVLPSRLVVFAIEGVNFEPGAAMTEAVAAAAGEVARRIVVELHLSSRQADRQMPSLNWGLSRFRNY